MSTTQICYFKIYLFPLVHRRPRGRGDTSKTNWFWKKARNWTRSLFSYWMKMLRMEKEENKRQGQMQLVSNPPIKKRTNVVWRRPTWEHWLEAFVPWRVRGWGEDEDLHRGYNLTTLDLILFLFSLFCFLFSFVLESSVKRERCAACVSNDTHYFCGNRFNIIHRMLKTTNKYEFREAQWTLEHQRDFFCFVQSL